MKNPNRETASRLDQLPNIGKVIAGELSRINLDHPKQLMGKDPFDLYAALCAATNKQQDPCVLDVLMSAVHFMDGGDPLPWWAFTEQRKRQSPSANTYE